MAEIIRATGFINDVQRLVMPDGFSADVTAYLWGGGGAGGGNDSHRGGNGCGAMCSVKTFTVEPGDIIDVAVGGGGQAGGTGAGQGSHPGIPGPGFTQESTLFTTLEMLNISNVVRRTYNRYPTFLNTYGVWERNWYNYNWYYNYNWWYNAPVFDHTRTVNFPLTKLYTFTGTCDNYFTVYVDGTAVLSGNNWQTVYNSQVLIPAGNHSVRVFGHNTGGPASIAVTITSDTVDQSFCGGYGGTAGPSGSSGAGGAGGGATVLFHNSTIIAVAGGGGGGGGGGNVGAAVGQDAPGDRGQDANSTAGQNGTNRTGDGAGGGGGGGGVNGGNGGTVPGGDTGGYSGMYGSSVGDTTYNPSALKPGGAAFPVYDGRGGLGGVYTTSGNGGYAVLVFRPTSYQVKLAGNWTPIQKAFIKVNGAWKESRNVFVKSNGTWSHIIGASDDYAPTLSKVPGYFGANPRAGIGGGGGGGGGKIICTKLYELGLMSKDIYEADQAFGAELVQVRPDIYNGYRAWAEIVVDWMSGGGPKMMPWMTDEEFSTAAAKWSTTWAQDIATPWAEEMAYRVGRKQQGSRTGRWIMAAGIPICKAVGVWQRWFGASKKPAGFGKGLMLIPVFVMFKLVAELGRLIERK